MSTLKSKINVIGIAETNLDKSLKDLYKLPGYNSEFGQKYLNKHKGSGVALYLNENIDYVPIKELTLCNEDIETLFVTASNINENPINIGIIYRPPSGNIDKFLSSFETILASSTHSTIITGDFNINIIKDSLQ